MALLVYLFLLAGLLFSCSAETSSMNMPISDEDGDMDSADMENSARGIVSLNIQPPTTSSYPVQHVVNLDLDEFDGEVSIHPSVLFTGETRRSDGSPLEATLTLQISDATNQIPGMVYSNYTAHTSTPDGSMAFASFSISVLPSTYTLYVFPKDESLVPPYVESDLDLSNGLIGRDIVLETGLVLKGVARTGAGAAIPFLHVAAYDRNEWKRSTIVRTDLEGRFELRLPSKDGMYDLELKGGTGNALWPYRVFSNAVQVKNMVVKPILPTTDQNEVILSYPKDFEFASCIMQGMVMSNGVPVVEARISLAAHLGEGNFQTSTRTDEEGRYSVTLLRTSADGLTDAYSVSLIPPSDSEAAAGRFSGIPCASDRVVKDFTLGQRPTLYGTVSDDAMEPVSGVNVQANRQVTSNDGNTYSKSIHTDENGRYELRIDPGTYELIFTPPGASDLATSVLSGLETSTDAEVNKVLHAGRIFKGVVLGESRNAIPWVYIDVYRSRPATGGSEWIGGGFSDDSGAFRIVLP